MKPKVSIIVAAYNIENYIERCLQSIINQTLRNIEIIVVNDGSTDNTLDIIKKISRIDKRITIVNQQNKGLIETRKIGLRKARGEYVLFIDGDDWLELNTLELLYDNATVNKSDIVIYNAFLSYDDMKQKYNNVSDNLDKDDNIKNLLLSKILPNIWSKFIKLEFIKSNNVVFPSNISFGEDLATVLSLFIHNPQISILDEYLYHYYQRNNSITKNKNDKVLEVDRALTFIEDKLRENNIYIKYEKEFEDLVFHHLFILWFLKYVDVEEINIKLYEQYKNRKLDINKNKIIKNKIRSYPLSLKIRIKCYDNSYQIGKLYDKLRYLLKGN